MAPMIRGPKKGKTLYGANEPSPATREEARLWWERMKEGWGHHAAQGLGTARQQPWGGPELGLEMGKPERGTGLRGRKSHHTVFLRSSILYLYLQYFPLGESFIFSQFVKFCFFGQNKF